MSSEQRGLTSTILSQVSEQRGVFAERDGVAGKSDFRGFAVTGEQIRKRPDNRKKNCQKGMGLGLSPGKAGGCQRGREKSRER